MRIERRSSCLLRQLLRQQGVLGQGVLALALHGGLGAVLELLVQLAQRLAAQLLQLLAHVEGVLLHLLFLFGVGGLFRSRHVLQGLHDAAQPHDLRLDDARGAEVLLKVLLALRHPPNRLRPHRALLLRLLYERLQLLGVLDLQVLQGPLEGRDLPDELHLVARQLGVLLLLLLLLVVEAVGLVRQRVLLRHEGAGGRGGHGVERSPKAYTL
jgi:hypothetical protein